MKIRGIEYKFQDLINEENQTYYHNLARRTTKTNEMIMSIIYYVKLYPEEIVVLYGKHFFDDIDRVCKRLNKDWFFYVTDYKKSNREISIGRLSIW
jgi:hypothetical protein